MTSTQAPSDNSRVPRPLSGLTLALLIMTTLAAFVALILLWATQWSIVHVASETTGSFDDADRAALATPLLWVGITLLTIMWIALWRWFRWHYLFAPIIVALIATALTGIFFWRSQTVDQPITITTWQCTPGSNPFSTDSSQILRNCKEQHLDTRLTLGPRDDRAAFTPEESDGPRADVPGLPVGTYTGFLTSTAPIDTASIMLATERNGTITPQRLLGIDAPFGNASRTWSTTIGLNPNDNSYLLLYYLSGNPALPDARITFNIQQCASTSPTAFDPDGCQPLTVDDWILQDVISGPGPAAYRQPIRTHEDDTVIYTNLEERTYTFTPLIGNKATSITDYRFLIIPSGGPQTSAASVLDISPGSSQETFSVDIAPNSVAHDYTIYIFPKQNIFADAPSREPAALAWKGILHP